jgi:hypothetical protein
VGFPAAVQNGGGGASHRFLRKLEADGGGVTDLSSDDNARLVGMALASQHHVDSDNLQSSCETVELRQEDNM